MFLDLHRLNIRKTRLLLAMAVTSTVLLTACNDTQGSGDTVAAEDLTVFAGCYTVSHDEPAQIKVSQQDGAWIMQMKEPANASRVWDDPEPLELIETAIYRSFSLLIRTMLMQSSVALIGCWCWLMSDLFMPI